MNGFSNRTVEELFNNLKIIKMKAIELVNSGVISEQELFDFVDGNLQTWESAQKILNEATGFKKAVLDLNTDEDFTNNDILNAEIIDAL